MIGFLSFLFGCNSKPEYPFDIEKAYCYHRQGVIAGGNFRLEFTPEGIVDYYSYINPAAENECGMKDRGGRIFFVGLKEGRVEVTAVYEYPTTEPEKYVFTLEVSKDLKVTMSE